VLWVNDVYQGLWWIEEVHTIYPFVDDKSDSHGGWASFSPGTPSVMAMGIRGCAISITKVITLAVFVVVLDF
jgi:hypothetical protein